jgi:hypothetical protein
MRQRPRQVLRDIQFQYLRHCSRQERRTCTKQTHLEKRKESKQT